MVAIGASSQLTGQSGTVVNCGGPISPSAGAIIFGFAVNYYFFGMNFTPDGTGETTMRNATDPTGNPPGFWAAHKASGVPTATLAVSQPWVGVTVEVTGSPTIDEVVAGWGAQSFASPAPDGALILVGVAQRAGPASIPAGFTLIQGIPGAGLGGPQVGYKIASSESNLYSSASGPAGTNMVIVRIGGGDPPVLEPPEIILPAFPVVRGTAHIRIG